MGEGLVAMRVAVGLGGVPWYGSEEKTTVPQTENWRQWEFLCSRQTNGQGECVRHDRRRGLKKETLGKFATIVSTLEHYKGEGGGNPTKRQSRQAMERREQLVNEALAQRDSLGDSRQEKGGREGGTPPAESAGQQADAMPTRHVKTGWGHVANKERR